MNTNTPWLHAAALLAAGTFTSVACAAGPNLLVNGSFEDATHFAEHPSGFDDASANLAAGSTAMTGWTTVHGDVAWVRNDNPYGETAQDGSYLLDLTAYERTALGGVTQTFATVAGASYDVSFELGYGGNGPNLSYTASQGPVSVVASAGGFSGSFTSPGDQSFSVRWTPETFSFVAAGSSSALTIVGSDRGPNNSFVLLLDSVDVRLASTSVTTPVPEPGNWALMAGGLLAVGAGLRRRRGAAPA